MENKRRTLLERCLARKGIGRPEFLQRTGLQRRDERVLSHVQQRTLSLESENHHGQLNNIRIAVMLEGSLDQQGLERAANRVIGEHQILRTSFSNLDTLKGRTAAASADLRIRFVDLVHLTSASTEVEFDRNWAEESNTPFDLSRAPLMRISLFRMKPDRHILLLTMHSVIADIPSAEIVINELVENYRTPSAEPSRVSPERLDHQDFVSWREARLSDKRFALRIDHTRRRLGDLAGIEFSLPASSSEQFAPVAREKECFVIGERLREQLKTLGRSAHSSLFTILLTAFDVTLYGSLGRRDKLVGLRVENRFRAEFDSAIGNFTNTLLTRSVLRGDENFFEVLARVASEVSSAFSTQDVPFEIVEQQVSSDRRHLLSEFGFSLRPASMIASNSSPPHLTLVRREDEAPKRGLSLVVDCGTGELSGSFNYSPEIYGEDAIRSLTREFLSVLELMSECKERTVAELIEIARSQVAEGRKAEGLSG